MTAVRNDLNQNLHDHILYLYIVSEYNMLHLNLESSFFILLYLNIIVGAQHTIVPYK